MTGTPTRATASPRLVPLSAARLVGNSLFRFVYPFLGVVAVEVGLGEGAEGLLISGLAVGGMLLPAVARVVVGPQDRPVHQTTVGLVTLFACTVVLGVFAPMAAAVSRAAGITVALLAMVALGAAKPLLDVGSMAYVSARTTWARRGRALSTMELTWAGGLLLLAPAGALAAATSWRVAVVLLGTAGLGAAALLRRRLDDDTLTAQLQQEAATGGDTPTDVTVVDAAPRADGRSMLLLFMLLVVLMFAALEMTFSVVGLWLEDVRGLSVARVSAVTSVGAVGELLGSGFTVALSDRLGKSRTAVIGMIACAVGFAVLGTAPLLPVAVAGLALGLFGTETAIVAMIALASEIDPIRRSRFLNLMVAGASVSRALAGAAGPLVLLRAGIGTNTAISAVAALAGTGVLSLLLRRVPRLRG